MDRQNIIKAKCRLYHALLSIPESELSDMSESDLCIMSALSKDKDIQDVIEKSLKKVDTH